MKQNVSKIKRAALTTLAVACAFSCTAAISANAASEQYVHTVSVNASAGSDASTWINMKKSASVSDEFGGYPTIYNNYSSSTNKSRAEYNDGKTKTQYKSFTLYSNRSAPTSVNYGTLSKTGNWRLYYQHVSGGGFRTSVTTIKWY